jgi:hypothetical protein
MPMLGVSANPNGERAMNVLGRRPRNDLQQSFGEQAARFSLYAPIAAILVGCFSRSSNSERSVVLALAWFNLALIGAGFVLGIIALLSMKKFGRERILGRALFGILINGLVLGLFVSVLMPSRASAAVRQQVVGRWQLQSSSQQQASSQLEVALNADGTFKLTSRSSDGRSGSVIGTWVMTPTRTVGITVDRVEGGGDTSLVGKKIGLGQVKQVDAGRLVLTTDKGEEVYQRLP